MDDDYTADRQIPNPSGPFLISDSLTPFPDTVNTVIHDQATGICQPPPPPQKLRPIRSNNGRNVTECSDPENRGVKRSVPDCYGAELGFLTQLSTQKPSEVNGRGTAVECQNTPQTCLGNRDLPEFGGVYGGSAAAVQQMKSEMDAELMKLISQGRNLETELSLSSDDDSESSEAMKAPMDHKRKRQRRKKLELFLESMMRNVMQKQDFMHKQLMEMLEKNEKERIIREEAWKLQEIERARREEEIRSEETSRSLALISYIQSLLGNEIQIPKSSCEVSCLEKDEEEITNREDPKCDPSSGRWPKSEVQALITVRTALDHKFLNGPKGSFWEEVALGLFKMGYSRNAKKCREKWENINKYYRRTTESGKNRPDYNKTCPYFHELDILYKNGLITNGNGINKLNNEIENKVD